MNKNIGETRKFIGHKFDHPMELTEVERNYAILLEYNSQVGSYFPAQMSVQIETPPNKVELKVNFWVVYNNLFEQMIHIYHDEFNVEVWSKTLENTKELGASFTPVSVKKVMQEPRKSNLELLWNFSGIEIQIDHLNYLYEFFNKKRNPTISKLKDYLVKNKIDSNLVYSFIFHKVIICQLESFLLEEDSVILLCSSLISKWH